MNGITGRCKENGMLLIGVPRYCKGSSSKTSETLITGTQTRILATTEEFHSVLFNIII
jgi:hypothetical protein